MGDQVQNRFVTVYGNFRGLFNETVYTSING